METSGVLCDRNNTSNNGLCTANSRTKTSSYGGVMPTPPLWDDESLSLASTSDHDHHRCHGGPFRRCGDDNDVVPSKDNGYRKDDTALEDVMARPRVISLDLDVSNSSRGSSNSVQTGTDAPVAPPPAPASARSKGKLQLSIERKDHQSSSNKNKTIKKNKQQGEDDCAAERESSSSSSALRRRNSFGRKPSFCMDRDDDVVDSRSRGKLPSLSLEDDDDDVEDDIFRRGARGLDSSPPPCKRLQSLSLDDESDGKNSSVRRCGLPSLSLDGDDDSDDSDRHGLGTMRGRISSEEDDDMGLDSRGGGNRRRCAGGCGRLPSLSLDDDDDDDDDDSSHDDKELDGRGGRNIKTNFQNRLSFLSLDDDDDDDDDDGLDSGRGGSSRSVHRAAPSLSFSLETNSIDRGCSIQRLPSLSLDDDDDDGDDENGPGRRGASARDPDEEDYDLEDSGVGNCNKNMKNTSRHGYYSGLGDSNSRHGVGGGPDEDCGGVERAVFELEVALGGLPTSDCGGDNNLNDLRGSSRGRCMFGRDDSFSDSDDDSDDDYNSFYDSVSSLNLDVSAWGITDNNVQSPTKSPTKSPTRKLSSPVHSPRKIGEPGRSCLADKTNRTGNGRSSPQRRSGGRRRLRVQFDSVEVREYSVTVGDHPCCGDSCPLTLEWDFAADTTVRQQVTHYDATRFIHRMQTGYGGTNPRRLSLTERRHRVLQVQGLNSEENEGGKNEKAQAESSPRSPLSVEALPAISKYQRYDDMDHDREASEAYNAVRRLEVHMELQRAQQNMEAVHNALHRVHQELEQELPAALAQIKTASDNTSNIQTVKSALSTVHQEITKAVQTVNHSDEDNNDEDDDNSMTAVQNALEKVHREMSRVQPRSPAVPAEIHRVHREIQEAANRILRPMKRVPSGLDEKDIEAARLALAKVHEEMSKHASGSNNGKAAATTPAPGARYRRKFDHNEMETVRKALSGVHQEMEAAPLILARRGGFDKKEMERVSNALSKVHQQIEQDIPFNQQRHRQTRLQEATAAAKAKEALSHIHRELTTKQKKEGVKRGGGKARATGGSSRALQQAQAVSEALHRVHQEIAKSAKSAKWRGLDWKQMETVKAALHRVHSELERAPPPLHHAPSPRPLRQASLENDDHGYGQHDETKQKPEQGRGEQVRTESSSQTSSSDAEDGDGQKHLQLVPYNNHRELIPYSNHNRAQHLLNSHAALHKALTTGLQRVHHDIEQVPRPIASSCLFSYHYHFCGGQQQSTEEAVDESSQQHNNQFPLRLDEDQMAELLAQMQQRHHLEVTTAEAGGSGRELLLLENGVDANILEDDDSPMGKPNQTNSRC